MLGFYQSWVIKIKRVLKSQAKFINLLTAGFTFISGWQALLKKFVRRVFLEYNSEIFKILKKSQEKMYPYGRINFK